MQQKEKSKYKIKIMERKGNEKWKMKSVLRKRV
jgi:hypothetical protein